MAVGGGKREWGGGVLDAKLEEGRGKQEKKRGKAGKEEKLLPIRTASKRGRPRIITCDDSMAEPGEPREQRESAESGERRPMELCSLSWAGYEKRARAAAEKRAAGVGAWVRPVVIGSLELFFLLRSCERVELS